MKHFVLSAALSLLLTSPLTAVTLSFQPNDGSEHTMTQTTTMQMGVDVAGQVMNINMELTHRLHLRVADATEGGVDLEARYDSMAVKVVMPQLTQVHYSGSKDPSDLMNALLDAIKDKPFHIKLAHSGRILDVYGLEGIQSAVDQVIEGSNSQQAQLFKQQLQGQFGASAIQDGILTFSPLFPDKAVEKGDSWQTSTSRTIANLPILESTTHTLKDITNSHYVIESVVDVQKSLDAQASNQGTPIANMVISGNNTIRYWMDKATGWLTKAEGTSDIKAHLDPNDPNTGGMAMTMTITTKTQLTGE